MENYPITYEGEIVGQVTLVKKGLFFCFSCTCKPGVELPFHIHLNAGTKSVDLGICVPEGAQYTLTKMLSSKQIPEGEREFLVVKRNVNQENLLPVQKDKPFSALQELENAKFVLDNGVPKIKIS